MSKKTPHQKPGRKPSGPFPPREIEVLRHAAAGRTEFETAVCMGISEHTVNWYRDRVKRKLGVYSITAAVAQAITAGIDLGVGPQPPVRPPWE